MVDRSPDAVAVPLLWSRGVRRVVGWGLVVAVVLPVTVGGAVLVIDILSS